MRLRHKLMRFLREGRAQGFATLVAIAILEELLDIETGSDATTLQYVAHHASMFAFDVLQRVRRL